MDPIKLGVQQEIQKTGVEHFKRPIIQNSLYCAHGM